MTKNTWKNIYNFDSSDSAFDFNDIASSISETTKSENVIKRNILIGGTEVENVPLILALNQNQSGGNQEELVSTEQLENKLREIFTGLDEPQQGGNIESSASEFSTENIDTVITENLQNGGDCGGEHDHEHSEDVIVNVPLHSLIGGELTLEEKDDFLKMHEETQELINAGQDMIKELISSESQEIKNEIKDLINMKLEHQEDIIKMNKETQELINAGNDAVIASINDLKGSGDCGVEEKDHCNEIESESGNIPLTLNL